METRIQKWGNSLAVRLPKDIAKRRSLKEGSFVIVSESDDKIVIEAQKKPSETLSNILKKVTPANLHAETEWGSSRGNEVW